MQDLKLEKESFIQGKIDGWHPRTTYKLGDGSKWKLVTAKVRRFKRTNPHVKLWVDDEEHHYLEVVGLVGKVKVSQIM